MTFYKVHLRYFRPSGTETNCFIELEASSTQMAITKAKRRIETEPARRVSRWSKCSASISEGASIGWSPPKPEQPLRAGDTLTVNIPFTGVLQHVDSNTVELIGQTFRHGTARRRMARKMLEELTGRKVEPRPPVVTTEFYTIYPNGAQYASDRPVKNSQYGVENLVQVKVTKHDGVIVDREFV